MILQIIGAILTLIGMGCAASGGGATPASLGKAPAIVQPPAQVTPPVTTSSLTYYALSASDNPQWNGHVGNGPIITHGYCVVYSASTYCWDDGAQGYSNEVANGVAQGPFYDSYWQSAMESYSGVMQFTAPCRGSCQLDLLTQPTIMDARWYASASTTAAMVNAILTTGTPKSVTCALNGTSLNCVDFTIDLSQIAF